MEKEKITISYGGKYGSIEFDPINMKVTIDFADEIVKSRITDYLQKEHVINTPDQSATDFSEKNYHALGSVESFRVVMSRMWEKVGVHVDWSVPNEAIAFLNSLT